MNDVMAVLLGLFFCIGWPLVWVFVALYFRKYRIPVEWRGFGQRREDADD